jgi:hypothetical protein
MRAKKQDIEVDSSLLLHIVNGKMKIFGLHSQSGRRGIRGLETGG